MQRAVCSHLRLQLLGHLSKACVQTTENSLRNTKGSIGGISKEMLLSNYKLAAIQWILRTVSFLYPASWSLSGLNKVIAYWGRLSEQQKAVIPKRFLKVTADGLLRSVALSEMFTWARLYCIVLYCTDTQCSEYTHQSPSPTNLLATYSPSQTHELSRNLLPPTYSRYNVK